jgi:predicted nucleotidyltransferase
MSHPEIIDKCKKITVEYLIDAIGRENIVSIILYGSVARNEESYKNVNGKLFLESDLDVLVVVKNRAAALKWSIHLKRLCNVITDQLRQKWLLSNVNLAITTEKRLLHAYPNVFNLFLTLSGRVIFGKKLIDLMPSYEFSEIPIDNLYRMIFGHMISVVRSVASSGIFDGNITTDGYNSILKSLRKLTLFLLRVVIIKDSIAIVNPFDLTEIRAKRSLHRIKNSIYDDLLSTYEDIELCDSKEVCSMVDLEKCLVRVIRQFNSTIAILTGINYPFVTLPKKLVFGQSPFIQRLEYSIYIFLINVETNFTLGLVKFMIFIMLGPESIYMRFYNLFVSSSNLMRITEDENENTDTFQLRQSWLKSYRKSLKPWKYDKAAE